MMQTIVQYNDNNMMNSPPPRKMMRGRMTRPRSGMPPTCPVHRDEQKHEQQQQRRRVIFPCLYHGGCGSASSSSSYTGTTSAIPQQQQSTSAHRHPRPPCARSSESKRRHVIVDEKWRLDQMLDTLPPFASSATAAPHTLESNNNILSCDSMDTSDRGVVLPLSLSSRSSLQRFLMTSSPHYAPHRVIDNDNLLGQPPSKTMTTTTSSSSGSRYGCPTTKQETHDENNDDDDNDLPMLPLLSEKSGGTSDDSNKSSANLLKPLLSPLLRTMSSVSKCSATPTISAPNLVTPGAPIATTPKASTPTVTPPNLRRKILPSCSESSDLPSLASTNSTCEDDDDDALAVVDPEDEEGAPHKEVGKDVVVVAAPSIMHHRVSFDSRVTVRVYADEEHERHQPKWYSDDEMNRFKREAIQIVLTYNSHKSQKNRSNKTTVVRPSAGELIATGTGRSIVRRQRSFSDPATTTTSKNWGRQGLLRQQQQQQANHPTILFSHAALRLDAKQCALECHEDQTDKTADTTAAAAAAFSSTTTQQQQQQQIKTELCNVLVVDPHPVYRDLLQKSFKVLLPHAQVRTCTSGADAVRETTQTNTEFDIVVIEEDLSSPSVSTCADQANTSTDETQTFFSGPALMRKIAETVQQGRRRPLLIGISTRSDEATRARFVEIGAADLVWPKPPPLMTDTLREDLLRRVLERRMKMHTVTSVEA